MMIRYERPYSYAAHWARRFARVSFVLFALSLLAHRFGPLTTPHFLALVGLSGVFALLGVLLAVVGLARLWQVAAIGGLASAAALASSHTIPDDVAGRGAILASIMSALINVPLVVRWGGVPQRRRQTALMLAGIALLGCVGVAVQSALPISPALARRYHLSSMVEGPSGGGSGHAADGRLG